MAVNPSMPTVFGALTQGLDQAPIGDGNYVSVSSKFLGIDKVSDALLPFLLLKTGSFQATEWDRFQTQVVWDVSGELKVKHDPEDVEQYLQQVTEALFNQVGLIRGLLVDDSLKVYPYSDAAVQPYRDGKLTALAFRGGPFITSLRTRPAQPDSPYRIADIVLRIEYISDHTPGAGTYPLLDLLTIGMTPIAPDRSFPAADPSVPWRYQLPIPAPPQDTVVAGRIVGPPSSVPQGDVQLSPPFPNRPVPYLKGIPYGTLVKEVVIQSASATIAANGGTTQLQAIANHIDGSSEYSTLTGTWTSLTPSKATVSASGLVTGANGGTGTVTIQNSFGGATGSATITLT